LYFKFFLFVIAQFILIVLLELLLLNSPIKFHYTSVIKDLGNLSSSVYAKRDPIYGYRLKENVQVEEYKINSLGFRSFEFTKKKPNNTLRIFFIGGSTTFGSNAGGNEYAIPDILNFILNSNSKLYKFEVINAGVLGYSTWQNKLKVREIFSYEPDLVFIMDGFTDAVRANDLSYEEIKKFTSENDKQLYEMSEVQNRFINFLNEQLEIVKLIKYLATKYQKSQLSISNIKEIKEIKENYTLKEKLKLFKTEFNLKEEVNFLLKNNTKVVILKNPWIIDTKERYESIKSNINGSKLIKNIDYNFYIRSYNEIHEILGRVCNELSIYCIDLHKTFQEIDDKNFPQKLFSDTFHFNRYGNFLIAKELSEFISSHQKEFFSDKDFIILPAYDEQYYNKFLKFSSHVGTEFLKNESVKFKKILHSEQFQLTVNKNFFAIGDNRYWNALKFNNSTENIIDFEFEDEINQFYFYPRVFGKDSYVRLYDGNLLIFELNGEYNGLTGIANYYLVETDYKFKSIKVVKKNADLWYRDNINNIFFKVK